MQQVSSSCPALREHAGSRGSPTFSYSTARFASIRSEVVILYMAFKSMLPSCSIYTGRPSYHSISHLLVIGHGPCPYFICLVVILGVIFEDLGLLVVVEVAGEVIEVCFFAPLLAVHEPG